MNYDFKSNWNNIILPLLSLPKVKKSIKKGITSYINDGNYYKDITYNPYECPVFYQRGDGWDVYIDDFEEKLTEKFLESGFLKKDENEPATNDNGEIDDYFDSSEYNKYLNYKNEILKPFIKHHEKTSLRAYQMFGACHWWNPTFGLTLAKLIYPNENWIIKSSDYHTTIVNKSETLVFDILYFDENDETKGGKKAIIDAVK
jgi:hypothetical protein